MVGWLCQTFSVKSNPLNLLSQKVTQNGLMVGWLGHVSNLLSQIESIPSNTSRRSWPKALPLSPPRPGPNETPASGGARGLGTRAKGPNKALFFQM